MSAITPDLIENRLRAYASALTDGTPPKYLNQRLSEIRDLVQTYIAHKYNTEIAKAANPGNWTPIQLLGHSFITSQVVLHNRKAVRKALPAYDFNNATFHRLVHDFGKKFEEQDARIQRLREKYGPLKIDTLFTPAEQEDLISPRTFNRKASSIGLSEKHMVFLNAFLGEELYNEICVHPGLFLKTIDKKVKEDEQFNNEATRDAHLWQRLEAARNIPLKDRTEMLQTLVSQLLHAQEFWAHLRKEIFPLYPEHDVDFVIHNYFSRFALGQVAATDADFEKIHQVLARRAMGLKIALNCLPLLRLADIDAAFHPIDTILLEKVLSAQLGFERYQIKLKKLDLYSRLKAEAAAEKELISSLQTMSPEEMGAFSTGLDAKDQELIQGLKKQAASENRPLLEVIQQAIHDHDLFMDQVQEQINELAKAQYVEPECIQQIANFTHDANTENVERLTAESEGGRYETLIERVAPLADNQIHALRSSFGDFYVFPTGNVLFTTKKGKEGQDPPDGRWAVIDIRHVPLEQKAAVQQAIQKQWTAGKLLRFLAPCKDYEAVSFDYQDGALVQRKDKKGPIRLFAESPSSVLNNQERTEFGQSTRLIRKSIVTTDENGKGWPSREYGDYVRLRIEPKNRGDREESRQMTAAVDRQMAIWTSRLVAKEILEGAIQERVGKNDPISSNFLRLSEFMNSIDFGDLSKAFEYNREPIYCKAQDSFNELTDLIVKQMEDQSAIPLLEADLQEIEREGKIYKALAKISEVISSFQKWEIQITEFLHAIKGNPRFAWYELQWTHLLPLLKGFINQFREVNSLSFEQLKLKFSPQEAEKSIRRSLRLFVEGMNQLREPLRQLALANVSQALQTKRNRLLKGNPSLQDFDTAHNNATKMFSVMELAVKEIIQKEVTQFSPLHFESIQAFAGIKQQTMAAERMRSAGIPEILRYQTEAQARAVYYPKN